LVVMILFDLISEICLVKFLSFFKQTNRNDLFKLQRFPKTRQLLISIMRFVLNEAKNIGLPSLWPNLGALQLPGMNILLILQTNGCIGIQQRLMEEPSAQVP